MATAPPTRFAARQDRVDPAFGEDATPGFVVWHARTVFHVKRWAEIEVGIENPLDENYHEHLTRETATATGGLAAGDEIPSPGRSLMAVARLTF